jgi:hypothetical protein
MNRILRWFFKDGAPEHPPQPKELLGPLASEDYFRGYRASKRHPHSPSTGSEGGCDICGMAASSPLHEQPWERLSEAELAAEKERDKRREARSAGVAPPPVRWGWDTGIRTGQGDAGDYIAHLREERSQGKSLTTLPTNVEGSIRLEGKAAEGFFKQAAAADDLEAAADPIIRQIVTVYGGKQDFPDLITVEHKEHPMRLNIKITAEDFTGAISAILDLAKYDGITVYEVTEDKGYESVTETHESSPTVDTSTIHHTDPDQIRAYMRAAAVYRDAPTEVLYKGQHDEHPRWRSVRVIGRAQHVKDAWRVFDLDKQEPRTFVLSGIQQVKESRL